MDEKTLNSLRGAIAEWEAETFHLPEVWGETWDDLPIGEKVKTGNAFLRAVRDGRVPEAEDTGRKAGGGRIYRKVQ
ncbi:DUF1413 domain-containing protein [Allosediminivita pacifica]|uniref:Uncharacterized protein DUF1413 n=1 Tax=Allosediminivita pacifica TaxID=1267769 RepID=A0A2T6B5X2_9RHOB|nr:DUF1413 domain-containing protein [Allosediminivita pacifica]PTX51469.1 uncharacterized protein DUF1413 [Allosediminivita pacifica]GGB00087.1 hypothetical protein GCM10011324_07900 [Allosediminivita pacifica]